MIGQKELLLKLSTLVKLEKFPKFAILCGSYGSGRHTICLELAKMLSKEYLIVDNKIDNIRETLTKIYNNSKTLYIFEDADNMSLNAKNVLLKMCEEPPSNATIVLLVENIDNVLETLKTRAQIFNMQKYTTEELKQFISDANLDLPTDSLSLVSYPGDAIRLCQKNNLDLFSYAKKVIDNLHRVSISNGLKISKVVKTTKNADSGFDIDLFLIALEQCSVTKFLQTKDENYARLTEIIIDAKRNIARVSINKLYEMDNLLIKGWLLWNSKN